VLVAGLVFESVPSSLAQHSDRDELLRYVRAGDVAEVERLLEAGVDPNEARGAERTALMTAAADGHEAVVRLLLDHGASIEHPVDGNDATALHYAHGVPVVKMLLEAGADPNAATHATRHGTRLNEAVSRDETEVARVLLQAGADPNLHVPLRGARPEIARLLLEAGADPDARIDSNSWTADGQTLLMAALRSEDPERAQFLIDAGADLTTSDAEGMTVLMYALRHGNDAVVDAALEAGADLTARTDDSLSVLTLAAGLGRTDIVRSALDAGADLNETAEVEVGPGSVAATPLTMAAMRGQTDTVRLLLDAGADPGVVDSDTGFGPLAAAAVTGRAPAVHLLLDAGADAEQTVFGVPLVEAATERQHDLVVALLQGLGDDPAVRRAVAMADELRTIAQELASWVDAHRDDARLEEYGSGLGPDADPDYMNQLFGIAGLGSGEGPLVGEHGTYSVSILDGELGVVGSAPDTDISVEALMQGGGPRTEITVRAILPE